MKHTVKRTRTVVEESVVEVPDYFAADDTPCGKVADFLLRHVEYVDDIEWVRCAIYSDDAGRFDNAYRQLSRVYSLAGAICEILGVKS